MIILIILIMLIVLIVLCRGEDERSQFYLFIFGRELAGTNALTEITLGTEILWI